MDAQTVAALDFDVIGNSHLYNLKWARQSRAKLSPATFILQGLSNEDKANKKPKFLRYPYFFPIIQNFITLN
ncbi:MAG: hypothetical protein GF311_15520 [Candidatus Lokiarchaeota archaeon]|nr:hypothetical protein [Candidatus Lokiarchaeota archaeon]